MSTSITQAQKNLADALSDLALLKGRSMVGLSADAKKALQLDLMVAERELQDAHAAVAAAHEFERSEAAVERRAQGRAARDEAVRISAGAIPQYASIADHLKQATEAAGAIDRDRIAMLASRVVMGDPANAAYRHEEIADASELAAGMRMELARAIACELKALIDALGCGQLIKTHYLVPEEMSTWAGCSIEDAAKVVHDRFAQMLRVKFPEPTQEQVAA